MAQEKSNPFVLPGFGQQGEAAKNPLFAGLEMMRQAWQNMAGAGRLDAAVMPPMSLEDLDQRIRELQTVQNWLQLNATMLANTIQGLEIQRSTLATLKSFAGQGAARSEASAQGASAPGSQAAEDWWKLIQQQFDDLAAATTASLQGVADAAQAAAQPAAKPKASARKAAPRKAAASSRTASRPLKHKSPS
ncbi:MAG TPA: PhaM family polyhydroxyalkanoate granule multifunctional regulatory protein [Castellaniella sp.]|uniref:PhaM family polyhydroxyalkanoate granule multifunctional regulatory protein n=1 Tax=Castellaniella sp. TaxID=1955812 RepID=UPI002F1E7EA1